MNILTRFFVSSAVYVCLFLSIQDINAQQPVSKNNASSGDRWVVGDKIFANSFSFNPAGQSLTLPAETRVMNMQFVRQKKLLITKNIKSLAVIDAKNFTLIRLLDYPEATEQGSMNGLAADENDSTIYFTGLQKNLFIGNISSSGTFTLTQKIDLSVNNRKVNPLGIGVVNNTALVALALTNKVAVVDLTAGKVVDSIPVGVCPYAIVISKDRQLAFVSNFGGPHPEKGDNTETSAGTSVAVDDRSVALRGSITVIDIASHKKIAEITTRIHPESISLSPDGRLLYVVDDSGDGISVIDAKTFKTINTIDTKPDASLPYGSLTSALAFSSDGKILFAANAGNNSIALIDPAHPKQGPYGFISAGGFPGAVSVDGNNLFIGNVTPLKSTSLQKVTIPGSKTEISAYTAEAKKAFHFIDILRAQGKAKQNIRPKPIPDNPGEPSSIKHVVYIIRENKKFDQELGDMGKGNCDPRLVEFGREITPNTHQLAQQFVLLDNYYCNGVNSSDGHQWAIQGITTPYHEKDFSNGHCAYDFGTDPLSYANCGFIWNHLLRKGISFRNFGETDLAAITKGKTWTDVYTSWKNKNDSAQYKCVYAMGSLKKYSDLRYPGWNLNITDQIRTDAFINALGEYEAAGSLPEFMIVYLPNDHTSGYNETTPTPRAYVADNDLATGRVIEALSKSSFWKDMVVFVNEDDPQSGTDHVDGHRSLCLVAGPYVKRDTLISRFYNQASVLHTICRIFGVPPMNQLVAAAPLMTECFRKTPDYSAYNCIIPSVSINEMNPIRSAIPSKTTARLAPLTQRMDFSKPDLIDGDALLFSKYVWSTIHGDQPFPKQYFGAHGKGLKALGLKRDALSKDGDD